MSRSVYFFTNPASIGPQTFETLALLHPELEWKLWAFHDADEKARFEAQAHAPDIMLSFLNNYILPAWLLERVTGRAFNVHPATPDFPGRDASHWAFYEGSTIAGATLHRMEPSVDSGQILDVITTPVDRARGVMEYDARAIACGVAVLLKNIGAILDGTIVPSQPMTWRSDAKKSRKEFAAMCRIDPSLPREEIQRRIEAFYNPAYRSLFVELHGYRFVYEPTSPPQST